LSKVEYSRCWPLRAQLVRQFAIAHVCLEGTQAASGLLDADTAQLRCFRCAIASGHRPITSPKEKVRASSRMTDEPGRVNTIMSQCWKVDSQWRSGCCHFPLNPLRSDT